MPRGARSAGVSSEVRIISSPVMGARKDRPLNRNAQPLPTPVITTPATAGPISRADWKLAEFSETALRSSCGPTISETNACRAGLSTTVARPTTKASA